MQRRTCRNLIFAAVVLLLLLLPAAALEPSDPTGASEDGSLPLGAPPVFGAYPTGGPVRGGTTVTIVGKEFGRINTVGLDRVRCSWGDPRAWQRSVFAAQQSEMDGWSSEAAALPRVPPAFFTGATRVASDVLVTPQLRATFALPSALAKVDLLECPSHEREAGDVSLWFSLRFYETEAENATAIRREPNLIDTGFTYMYYPAPSNFSNAAITGGPVHGGTAVVIEGSGFTRGYRSELDIDLDHLIMRCRFTDKPSVVSFRACPADPTSPFVGATPLSVVFDVPTNGLQLATSLDSGIVRHLTSADVDGYFAFATASGDPVRLAEQYVGQWLDARWLVLHVTNSPADTQAGTASAQRLTGGSGLTLSVRDGQRLLRLQGSAPPWLDGSAPVSTRGVALSSCFASNESSTEETILPQVSFVSPIVLTPTRVVCISPSRSSPVASDLDIALNGQDFHSNALQYAYYVQPTVLTHLTPVTAGPTIGGSVVTVHGRGLAAFHRWGADADRARCRWHGAEMTVPTYVADDRLVCASAMQPFTAPTEVLLEVALNDRDFVAVTASTTLRYTYYVQPRHVKAISPTGGRIGGGTHVTVDGGGFEAYPGVNVSDVRLGWGDAEEANLTVPTLLSESRIVVRARAAVEPGAQQLYLALNSLNLLPINASFLYYEQPSNYSACEPTGGPTRGGTAVTIQGGPFDVFSTDASTTLCRFGVSYVRAAIFERHRIVCETPPADVPGTVPVAISFNGAETDFEPIGHSFKYYQQPRPKGIGGAIRGELDEIMPVGGPRGGQTRVTILGSGFTAFSSMKVFVRCRWQAPLVDVVAAIRAGTQKLSPPESGAIEHTDSRIVCPSPPARAGASDLVNLTLSLNALDFGDTGLTFQYYALPKVTSITPSGGHRTGGTVVTIAGGGFDVLQGGKYVSCQYGSPYNKAYNERYTITRPSLVTASAIVCLAPSTKVTDTRELWVALNGYELGSGRDARATGQNYTYYNPPTVFSVLPQAGVFSGGTVVTLLGQGFHGLAGNTLLASCRFLTSNSISDTRPIELRPDFWTCRSPNQTGIAEGEAALVLVTLNAQQYVDTTYRFSYYGLRIDAISVNGAPPGGVTDGATVVTLAGFGFDRGPVRFCRFGLLPRVEVRDVTAERLLCATPPSADAGDVHLLLSNDDVVYIDTGLDYTYYVQPTTFSAVSPEGGPKRGGTLVTLTGSGFAAFISLSQPLSADAKRQAARCLWGGEFSSSLSIEGVLRNAPRTSPVAQGALAMSGKAGVTAPTIASAVLADPDNGDASFSRGDTLTIHFDMATNKGAEGLLSDRGLLTEAGDRALVGRLFSFSHSLGARYHGRWLDASSFLITVVDATGGALPAMLSSASVAVVGDIKNANQLSRWCKAVAPLSGSTGTQQAPTISRFEAQMWDLQDVSWSRYDTLSVHLDLPTDRGGREGGKAFVDTTLAFSQALGADYSGAWTDPATFVVTVLDPTGAGEGPRVNASSGAVVTVAGWLHNAPGTSPRSHAAHRMSFGDFGRSNAEPRLLRFYARDGDNSNASYDTGDQVVVQFDMAVNRGVCLRATSSFDNRPICAQRAGGGMALVDSVLSVSATIGANYSGMWEDGSTFVVTVIEPLPDAEHAPRPYDTVLSILPDAGISNVAETTPPLSLGPVLLGVAERVDALPRPPRLVDAYASDFNNRDLVPSRGDTIALRFDVPTDRALGAYDELAGTLSCHFGCSLESAQVHRLFDFFDRGGQRLTAPFFLEYSSGWIDDSTFVVEVINGSSALQPGILASEWSEAASALADTGTRVALREGVSVQSLSCPAKYLGSAHCKAPTGLFDGPLGYAAPLLHGDFGRVTAPRIAKFSADDPDNGDGAFGRLDLLTITFDQRTNRGATHTNFGRPNAAVTAEGVVTQIGYPLGVDGLVGKELVDALFLFSHALGADYSGAWLDDSTFQVTVLDATGSDADPPQVGIVNVTAKPSGGITSFNLTAKTCFNLTNMRLHHQNDYASLLHDPALVNSSLHRCELHYANLTSPVLSGDLGVPSYPTLLSATVDDVDNGDEVYGTGDVIVLQFDMPTNRPSSAAGGANSTSNAKSGVDAHFSFSAPLGAQYSGEWSKADRFIVTVVDGTGGALEIGRTEVTIVSQDIRNAAGDALTANNQTATVFGDFGTLAEPAISRFTAVVAANASNYTDGDTVVLQFDMQTNRGGGSHGTHGDKAFVDHLFGFSAVLGADYSGGWESGEGPACADGGVTTIHACFVVTLLDTRGGAAVSGRTISASSIHLRSSSSQSARAANRLMGDQGRRLGPLLVDFFANDDDNSAEGIDAGDTLTIAFDVPTDVGVTPPQPWGSGVGGGATSGGATYVDSLFRFCGSECPSDAEEGGGGTPSSLVRVGASYSGAWTDESTFVIMLVDATGSTLAIGNTVVQSRAVAGGGQGRLIRFRRGISDFSNSTSPALAGSFGTSARPVLTAFVARDPDHADTSYSAFDELVLRFSIPTDRGHLPSISGDKRFVDRHFEFSCNLGLDYSGEWTDPREAIVTVLDGTVGHNPAMLAAAGQLGTLRVSASPHAIILNKPGTSGAATTDVQRPMPPLRGSQFPNDGGTQLCAGVANCDFGDHSAPQLLDAYVGDLDNSGSWTALDQLRLTFDRPTNLLGADGVGSLDTGAIFNAFDFRAVNNLGSLDAAGSEWLLGDALRGNWTDASTLVIEPLYINDTIAAQAMPDPTQCGLTDAAGDLIPCPSQKAMGGPTGAHQAFNIPAGQGFRLRVAVNGSAGLRTESDSPLAGAAMGSVNFQLLHCYAGALVVAASIRDPDNLDTVFSEGDELTVVFNVETARAPVRTKWEIDKLLTFCTPCNPGCERSPEGSLYDSEYNGLGTEYSGAWKDARTLVITILNATMPSEGLCLANENGKTSMLFVPNSWRVMTSYSATQAPMLRCFGGSYDTECSYGEASNERVADQFGNEGLERYARMLGPRYPHRWSQVEDGCENYMQFWTEYQMGIYAPISISGSVGPLGTPQIVRLVANDPDDLDTQYGPGDQLTVVFEIATDRSNTTQHGSYSGDRLYVDSLFSFNAQLGQDYTGAWADDSQFVVTILDASWRTGTAFGSDGRARADNNCTAALRAGLMVRNLASTSAPLEGSSPPMGGDAGLDEAPALISIVGEDPDLGDVSVAYGDRLTLTFDRATDMGCASVGGGGACPYAVGAALPQSAVEGFFNFSVSIGAAYGGMWTDASTFVLSVLDGLDSELNSELGSIMVNSLGTVSNQGCRPAVRDRIGRTGLCNAAVEYVGPVVAREGVATMPASPFVAYFGVTPNVVLVEVDDPDNGDAVYGPGDEVRVYFDQATDRAVSEASARPVAGDRDYVDSLMRFSMPLGLEYMGEWEDASTFVVTVISTLIAPVSRDDFETHLGTAAEFGSLDVDEDNALSAAEFELGFERISVALQTQLRDITSRSRPSLGMATATADEAKLRSRFPVYESTTPAIVHVAAEDPDNGDAVFGRGDVITVRFSANTDFGSVSGSKAFVDRLFRFDPPIGEDYTGGWIDAQHFAVRALDTVGGELRVCNHVGCTPSDQSNVTLVGLLRNRGGTSPVAVSNAHLSGISDSGAPQIEVFEMSDPDDRDYVFSNGDQVRIAFDRPSDLGAVEAKRKRVDALFSFNIPLGEDYSGEWRDDSVFAITITDTRYDLPLINQTAITPLRPVRAANGTSTPANVTSVTLQGHFGRERRPRLARFALSRLRRELGAIPGPPLYSLTFDEPTNHDAAKASVDELFSFSVLLGGTYSGAWADASTFELAVLDQLANTSFGETPAVGRTAANFTGRVPLFNAAGRLPASSNELVHLEGDPAELIGPNTDVPPVPVLPRVASFFLLDGGDGGLRSDGTFGANASLLLVFNTTAHDPVGAIWRHEFVNENSSSTFPGGAWSLAGDGSDPFAGVHSAPEGLLFSVPLGERYTGEWLSRKWLLLRVLELTRDDTVPRPRVNQTKVHTRIGSRSTTLTTLQTNIGSSVPPRLLSATANDPDSLDCVYSSSDTVSIAYDRSTDRAAGARSGNKAFVDAVPRWRFEQRQPPPRLTSERRGPHLQLFSFTQPLAYDYSGEWLPGLLDTDSVFRITLLQATCPGCTPMAGIATVKPTDTAYIRTRAASSPRAFAPSPPLDGDYGKTRGPQIVSFVADDFDNGDDVYGSGDTLTVTFDLASDRGGTDVKATSVNVEDMLLFSHSLGENALSQWSDDSTLVITIISPAGADDVLVGKTTVRPQRQVRNKGCCEAYTREGCQRGFACCCYNATDLAPVPLSGDFGNLQPPAISSFVGDDPDDGDAQYGASDVLVVSFDMATDRGKGDPFGGKSWVDDLLWFSLPVGDDYSGEWVEEDKAVRISILAPASTLSNLPEAAYACQQLPPPPPPPDAATATAPSPTAAPGATVACFDGVVPVSLLNVSDAYWRQTLVSARGDGYDNDGDGNGGDVRNRAGTSAAAGVPPLVQGQLGNLGAPSIVAFVADDPNNGDTAYGNGDVLTVVLDRPVDRTDISSDLVPDRDAVDRLFGFTTPLGTEYRGKWNDTSTFVIVVDDASGAGPIELGQTRVHASVRYDAVRLRNRAGCGGTAEPSCLMPYVPPPPQLAGDFGRLPEPPRLLGASIEDYDNADSVYSANDTITVRFDRPTNYAGGPRDGGRSFVDALLNFSTPLGNDYAGAWSEDGSALVVTTFDAGNGTVSLELLRDANGTVISAPTYVSVIGEVRTRAGNSPPAAVNLTAALVGGVGDNSSTAFPRVVSAIAREVKRGELWTIELGLDRASDRGRTRLSASLCPALAVQLSQECVLQLFTFTPADALTWPSPDATIHGSWEDDSTFVATTTLDVASPGLKFGEGQEDYLQIGTTDMLYTSGIVVNGSQHCDEQPEFTQCPYMVQQGPPDAPTLASFTVEDADNLDAVLSPGDEYKLTFDVPTDQADCAPTCRGGPEYVLRIFAFSSQLASDYVGEWRDNRTFAITVTRVEPDFVAPPIASTIAALRPANADLQTISEADMQPWLQQMGVAYQDVVPDQGLVPDRIQVRTANGLSGYATHSCAALSLTSCDEPVTGTRPVPVLRGAYGVLAAPSIVSFVADDPDDFDELYSAGDTVTLTLDMATDALLAPREAAGDRDFVNGLFAFSHVLGADYSGRWADASTFVVRVLDVAGAGTPAMSGPCEPKNATLASLPEDNCLYNRLVLPPAPLSGSAGGMGTPPPPPAWPAYAPAYVAWPPPVYAFFNSSAALRGVAGRSQSTVEPTSLGGTFGVSAAPTVLSWTAADFDQDDPSFSPGDTLSLRFDMRTNMGGALLPVAGGRAFVDTLLEFSVSLGADYSGAWEDASTLVVTAMDTTDAAPPRIGLARVTVRSGDHNITNEHGTSAGCMGSAVMQGSFGSTRPPRLVAVVIDDEDNGDEVYGYCDVLTFSFDMATDKAGGRELIDVYDLFYFANPLETAAGAAECDVPFAGECPVYDITNGLSYSGEWSADGSAYTLRLQCPAPPDTPSAAVANAYGGAQPVPYLVGNSTETLTAYEIAVARLRIGITRVRLRADVRNVRRNLRPPILEGEFGSTDEPYIVSYVASNYENADAVYGASDLLTITFDKPTDKAGGERYGLKNYVDGLFSFSEGDPADDYSGEWRDDSTFVVRLIDPTDIVPSVAGRVPFSTRPSDLRVSTAGGAGLPGALIQNRGVSLDRTASASVVVPATGDFGRVVSPTLVAFAAQDADNGDDVLSQGDELLLRFDVATDRGGAARRFYRSDPANRVDRVEIDRLFAFSHSLGTDYTGLWSDESTLAITVANCTDADAAVGATHAIVRDARGGLIFNAAGNSAGATGSALLGGSFGLLDAPVIEEFLVEDLDNADTIYGEGDSLRIIFDRTTDRGGPAASLKGAEAFVEGLFSFSHTLGSRFSGEWHDASSFVVTVVNASGEAVTTGGTVLQPDVRCTPFPSIRNRAGVAALDGSPLPAATAPSPPLEQRGAGVGSLAPPVLQSFVASDPDGGDHTYGVGDALAITFFGRSNRGAHQGGRAFVDSLFHMDPALGAAYSGEWRDGSTFVVDVLEASNARSDYSGAFQTTPTVLTDDQVVCASFDRGASTSFPDGEWPI